MLKGAGRVLDLTGISNAPLYGTYHKRPDEADFNALKGDWERIGQDFRQAANATTRRHG